MVPSMPFTAGHRYAVLLFGGTDAAGLRGATGEGVIASPAFFFLRSPKPLVVRCGDASNPDCACPPSAISDPTDTSCHSAVLGLTDAQARQAEPQRRQLQTALSQLLPLVAPGRDQDDVVLFWTFTISTQPFTVFDPATGNIPFPNDVLIDQTTRLVKLPIAPGDPMASAKMALNTLDGFSVSAPETIGVEGPAPVNDQTLVPNRSVFFLNIGTQSMTAQPEYAVATAFSQIVVQPTMPLISDQSHYAVVITSGVADTSGQALLPPAAVWLVTGPDPLFDGTHSTVSGVSDAEAQQLEALRMAEQPLVAQLGALGIPREAIAGLWTFTTQSIARPNAALDAFPTQALLPTDVSSRKWRIRRRWRPRSARELPDAREVPRARDLHVGVGDRSDDRAHQLYAHAGGAFNVHAPAGAPTTTIRFWLTLPNGAEPGAAGHRAARADLVARRRLAARRPARASGLGAIGFDIDYHGARSKCTADNQCQSGTCNVATGACSGGFIPTPTSSDPLACDIAAVSADPSDCRPTISGQNYVNPTNLFLGRTNGQQYIVDARSWCASSPTRPTRTACRRLAAQVTPVTPTLDPAKLGFLGQSLGAIDGAVFVSAAAQPRVAVLNVGGGHLFDILSNSPAFSPLIDPYLKSIGVDARHRGVRAARRDGGVGARSGRSVVGRAVAARQAGDRAGGRHGHGDPAVFEEALAQAIFGTPVSMPCTTRKGKPSNGALVSTYFPAAPRRPLPTATGTAKVTQALGFLTSFGAVLPAP